MRILKQAQIAANEILERDVNLVADENVLLKKKIDKLFNQRLEL